MPSQCILFLWLTIEMVSGAESLLIHGDMQNHIHRVSFLSSFRSSQMTFTVYSGGLRKVQQAQFPQRDIHHSGPETSGAHPKTRSTRCLMKERARIFLRRIHFSLDRFFATQPSEISYRVQKWASLISKDFKDNPDSASIDKIQASSSCRIFHV